MFDSPSMNNEGRQWFPELNLTFHTTQFLLCSLIRNLTLHPLAHIPGPKSWAATRLRFIVSLIGGSLVHDVRAIHQRYGSIVRLAPNEVSFAREDAFHDIYGIRPGHSPFPKNLIFFTPPPGQPHSMVTTANVADHARMRKVMNRAFLSSALRAQEPIVEAYVSLLVERLREQIELSRHNDQVFDTNMVDWYNYVAFDIVGDLGFGESFQCLQSASLHPWIALVFRFLKGMTLAAAARYYPWLSLLLAKFLVPKSLLKMASDHYQLAHEKVSRRMNLEKGRADFMTPVLCQGVFDDTEVMDDGNGGSRVSEGMTMSEIESTFSMLIIAGSETIGTTLAGITNYLIQSPDVLQILQLEIRTAFPTEDRISVATATDLPYLNAVIREGLRLCNPIPAGLPRIVPPGGDYVVGLWLPAGTHVSVHPWSISNDPNLWHDPEAFVPSRWLPIRETQLNGEEARAGDNDENMDNDGDNCGLYRPTEYENDHLSASRPFSEGSRACIGKALALAEMRLVLARLVWAFDMSVPRGSGRAVLDWRRLKTFVVVEKQDVWVRLRARDW